MKQEVILKLSKLAKLDFNNDEHEVFSTELEKMIGMIQSINDVNTENIEPLVYIHKDVIDPRNDQEIVEPLDRELAIKNAPAESNNFFVVPKVIGD